jgi:hypothetical protein
LSAQQPGPKIAAPRRPVSPIDSVRTGSLESALLGEAELSGVFDLGPGHERVAFHGSRISSLRQASNLLGPGNRAALRVKFLADKGFVIIDTVGERIEFLPERSGFSGGAHSYWVGNPNKPAGRWRWPEGHGGLRLQCPGSKLFPCGGDEILD